ncbi:antitoxin Xre/MbcA/ParS toxin-binding domain-containing protein [Thiohalobacter sp.]|uniref:antitoxin Xre/MbcA/ParS toxin-binding domain-containing protein n=1 Tax=Thiohalobacter sp. TaxID=2025948 RepID=UPI00262AB83D|nr:antitoxin Xre/MbcA/ParS toxin-binding domain-containing protein [Thiohalobacter sp.]
MLENLTDEERKALTRAVINILDRWGMDNSDQVRILALPEGTPARRINRYRDMGEALPDNPATMERIEQLLGIADALRTMFPHNPQMGLHWLRKRNKHLRRRTPAECMVEDGMSGLIRVRTHLDCTYAWDMSGSHA